MVRDHPFLDGLGNWMIWIHKMFCIRCPVLFNFCLNIPHSSENLTKIYTACICKIIGLTSTLSLRQWQDSSRVTCCREGVHSGE